MYVGQLLRLKLMHSLLRCLCEGSKEQNMGPTCSCKRPSCVIIVIVVVVMVVVVHVVIVVFVVIVVAQKTAE